MSDNGVYRLYETAGYLFVVAILVFHAAWIAGVLAGAEPLTAVIVAVPLWGTAMAGSLFCGWLGDMLSRGSR